jgi:signal recognition particle subunit SRP54
MDQEVVARSADKLMSGRFTLDDFLDQLHQVQKMGSLGGILRLMPGMSKEIRQAADQIDDKQVSRIEAIVRSMTPGERADPVVVDGSRRVRIARGSGTSTQEVNQLLKQFKEMQKMMRGMGSGALAGAPGGRLGRMAAARGLGGGSAEDSLAEMLGGRAGTAPKSEARPPVGGAKGRGGRNKKKGGRVTPPKGR